MKKSFLYIFAGILSLAVLHALSACSGSGNSENEADAEVDTAKYTAQSDTLSRLIGQYQGYYIVEQLNSYRELEDSTYNVNDFVNGLSIALDRRHSSEYSAGTTVGMNMAYELNQFDKADKKIDRDKVLKAFDAAFAIDSVSFEDMSGVQERYSALANRFVAETNPSAAMADSLADAYGTFAGYVIAGDRAQFEQTEGRKFESKDFVAGLKKVAAEPRSREFLAGLNQALQIIQNIVQIEKVGINIKNATVLDNLRKIITEGKTADEARIKELGDKLNGMINRQMELYDKAEEARLAETDEAKQNVITGRALVDKMKKSTPEAKTTESGLTYVIYEQGKGDPITDTSTVTAKYTGSHLDGKVFDANNEGTLSLQHIIPGLAEGLKMLRPGARATFWVPGNLAYGARGVPQAGIEPMETLVFDITVLDVK